MKIAFSKYHGAGNDFILINDPGGDFPGHDHNLISRMCARHTGIGADGLMLLRPAGRQDFSMIYYNADGHEGTMCGNGGRCLVSFARAKGVIRKNTGICFLAIDGEHRADILDNGDVALKMKDVRQVGRSGNGYDLDTGSLHYVEYVDNLVDIDVYRRGRTIRHKSEYAPVGRNVNFVQAGHGAELSIRTYERGVENETLACGTGSVASAIVHHYTGHVHSEYLIRTQGGLLRVRFDHDRGCYHNVWLEGPAVFVFRGTWPE